MKRSGKTLRFDTWIEFDSTRGRLDAMGPLNTPLASIVWNDSAWRAWLPGQGTLLRGTGPAMNLPVLDLRNVRPSQLLAPLLGRATEVAGPIRVLPSDKNQIAILPFIQDPAWALLLDAATGIPVRHQTLSQGKETEGVAFFDWKSHAGVLVPSRIVRTTPDGQVLELKVAHWERMDSIPFSHTQLHVPAATDTISIGTRENGRKIFRIRAFGGDTAVVMLHHPGALGSVDLEPDPSDSAVEDTTSEEPDDTDVEDSGDDESPVQVVPAHPAAKPSKKL